MAYRHVLDTFRNVTTVIGDAEEWFDIDQYLKDGTVTMGLEGYVETSTYAGWQWFNEWAHEPKVTPAELDHLPDELEYNTTLTTVEQLTQNLFQMINGTSRIFYLNTADLGGWDMLYGTAKTIVNRTTTAYLFKAHPIEVDGQTYYQLKCYNADGTLRLSGLDGGNGDGVNVTTGVNPVLFIGSTRENGPFAYGQDLVNGSIWDIQPKNGGFFTPRLHVRYSPWEMLTLRASAGKGYRTPHPLAENTTLLASGRTVIVGTDLQQEEAWNMGLSAGLHLPIKGKTLELNAEYYHTDFVHQTVVNFDGNQGEHTLAFENLQGKSYSHTFQIDATYPFFDGFTATGAFRLNDVKCSYDGELRQKYLTSRYKGLLTLSYKTPLELWQLDVTGQLNGGGKLYDRTDYPAYFQLQAQVTREFRHFSIYLGGENLTNYKISEPIQHAHHPWSPSFDATQIWGPVTGAMAYIGIRIRFEKL